MVKSVVRQSVTMLCCEGVSPRLPSSISRQGFDLEVNCGAAKHRAIRTLTSRICGVGSVLGKMGFH